VPKISLELGTRTLPPGAKQRAAISWQGRGAHNPGRGEALHPCAEGHQGRDECGKKGEERGSGNIVGSLELNVFALIQNVCE